MMVRQSGDISLSTKTCPKFPWMSLRSQTRTRSQQTRNKGRQLPSASTQLHGNKGSSYMIYWVPLVINLMKGLPAGWPRRTVILGKRRSRTSQARWRKYNAMKTKIFLSCCQLVMSSWDIRGFTLEANIDKLDEKNKFFSSVDIEPCTGDQLADSEKVGLLKKSRFLLILKNHLW